MRAHELLAAAAAGAGRVEQHQQTLVNWLNPPDQSSLETTIVFEQIAIKVTAALAQQELDSYLAQVYRLGLLEDFDHMSPYALAELPGAAKQRGSPSETVAADYCWVPGTKLVARATEMPATVRSVS